MTAHPVAEFGEPMYNSCRLVGGSYYKPIQRFSACAGQAVSTVVALAEAGADPRSTQGMDRLYWDDAYAIALALIEYYPDVDPLNVEWEKLHQCVVRLPEFADDPSVQYLGWLCDIQKEWYEEVSSR